MDCVMKVRLDSYARGGKKNRRQDAAWMKKTVRSYSREVILFIYLFCAADSHSHLHAKTSSHRLVIHPSQSGTD